MQMASPKLVNSKKTISINLSKEHIFFSHGKKLSNKRQLTHSRVEDEDEDDKFK